MTNLIGDSSDPTVPAVKGESTSGGFGVLGICDVGHGVHGQSKTSRGVVGESEEFHGVFGKSRNNVGVAAESQNTEAMNALSHSGNHAAIIAIDDANGPGIQGTLMAMLVFSASPIPAAESVERAIPTLAYRATANLGRGCVAPLSEVEALKVSATFLKAWSGRAYRAPACWG